MEKPLITNKYTGHSGETAIFEYFDSDTLDHLPKELLSQVQIMAFHNGKLLVVNNVTKPGRYGPVGGGIDEGETAEETLHRELKEEANMKAIDFKLLGYQKATNLSRPDKPIEYQVRYYAKVEPIGKFEGDPDGDVTELLEIEAEEYKKYFDWGETGEHLMKRSVEINRDKI